MVSGDECRVMEVVWCRDECRVMVSGDECRVMEVVWCQGMSVESWR